MQEERQAGLFSPVEVLGTNYLLRIDQNKCRLQMSRVYFSKWYRIVYLILICLALMGGVSVYFFWDVQWCVVCIAASIISLMLGDTAWRIGTQGLSTYFKDWRSLFDLFFTLVTISVLLLATLYRLKDHLYFCFGLVIVNVISLLLRLHKLVKSFHRTEMSIIDLNDMSEVDRNADANKSGILMLPNSESQDSARQDDCADFIRDRQEDP